MYAVCTLRRRINGSKQVNLSTLMTEVAKREQDKRSLSIPLYLGFLVDSEVNFPPRESIRVKDVESYVDNLSERIKKTKEVNIKVIEARSLLFEMLAQKALRISTDRRIFSITAPTGYGKTLLGIHFAIKLRERLLSKGLNSRIIYVAPILSIIDQNLEVIRKALNITSTQSNLLAHHHVAEMKYKKVKMKHLAR
jgi:CRISPR/Cas system-associated endonuclease/helicase Cas3